jgi:hypothetical protein
MLTSSIRDAVYFITLPYFYGGGRPVSRDPDECEATYLGHYTKCPLKCESSRYSPWVNYALFHRGCTGDGS